MLPAQAKTKLSKLEQEYEDCFALLNAAKHSAGVYRGQLGDAMNYLNSLGPDDKRRKDAEIAVTELKAQIESAENQARTRRERHKAVGQIIAQIQAFLNRNPGEFEAVPLPKVKNESLGSLRESIQAAKVELAKLKRTRLDNATLKKQATEYVRRLGESAKPVLGDLRNEFSPSNPATTFDGYSAYVSAIALQAWIHPDALIKALHEQIDALPGEGMQADERAAKVATLERELLALERQEEAVIVSAAEYIPRRWDADPLAILSIQPLRRKAA